MSELQQAIKRLERIEAELAIEVNDLRESAGYIQRQLADLCAAREELERLAGKD